MAWGRTEAGFTRWNVGKPITGFAPTEYSLGALPGRLAPVPHPLKNKDLPKE